MSIAFRAVVQVSVAAMVGLAALAAAAPAGPSRPDLHVATASVQRVDTPTGRAVRVSARIRNARRRTARSSRVGVYLSRDARRGRDDRRLRRVLIRPVRGRKVVPAHARVTIPSAIRGRWRIVVCADDTRRIRERREDNNCKAAAQVVTIGPGDSLAVGAPAPVGVPSPSGDVSLGGAPGAPPLPTSLGDAVGAVGAPPPVPVLAAPPIGVTSAADAPDLMPGDGRCLATTGGCTLRAAIAEANAAAGPAAIVLPAITVRLSIEPLNENGIASGDLDITDALQIIGQGPSLTTIDGGAPPNDSAPVPGLDRLFEVHQGAGDVTLYGLHLRDGSTAEHGGALLNAGDAAVRLAHATISGSRAGKSGGAGANTGSGELALDHVTLTGNVAGETGGALSGEAGRVTLRRTTAGANQAGVRGGAIDAPGGALTVVRTLLHANSAPYGGAIAGADGHVAIDATELRANEAVGHDGGAIAIAGEGSVALSASVLAANHAGGEGGA